MPRLLYGTAAALALWAAPAAAGAPPDRPAFELAQGTRQSCVSRCRSVRDRCMAEIPTVTGPQGQRYKPADDVRACGNAYGQCLSGCPDR